MKLRRRGSLQMHNIDEAEAREAAHREAAERAAAEAAAEQAAAAARAQVADVRHLGIRRAYGCAASNGHASCSGVVQGPVLLDEKQGLGPASFHTLAATAQAAAAVEGSRTAQGVPVPQHPSGSAPGDADVAAAPVDMQV
jgi:translation initiation factor IF-2